MGDEKRRNRSPVHPSMDLASAVEVAEKLCTEQGFAAEPIPVAMGHLNYASKSSSGLRAIAALIHFGLAEDSGSGDDRRIKLTDLTRRILRTRQEGREDWPAIRDAALMPVIYQKLWQKWFTGGDPPSRATMRWELEHDWGFNPSAIEGFVKDFFATLAYASLEKSVEEADIATGRPTAETPSAAWTTRTRSGLPEANAGRTTPRPPQSSGATVPAMQQDSQGQAHTILLPGGEVATLILPRPLSRTILDAFDNWVQYAKKVENVTPPSSNTPGRGHGA